MQPKYRSRRSRHSHRNLRSHRVVHTVHRTPHSRLAGHTGHHTLRTLHSRRADHRSPLVVHTAHHSLRNRHNHQAFQVAGTWACPKASAHIGNTGAGNHNRVPGMSRRATGPRKHDLTASGRHNCRHSV